MNRAMVRTAHQSAAGVDLVALLVDAHRGLGAGDDETAEWLRSSGVRRIAVLNKIDLLRSKALLLPMMERAVGEWGCEAALPVSALRGDGCEQLVDGPGLRGLIRHLGSAAMPVVGLGFRPWAHRALVVPADAPSRCWRRWRSASA